MREPVVGPQSLVREAHTFPGPHLVAATALDRVLPAEHVADGAAQCLGAVDDEQPSAVRPQPAVHQLIEQALAHRGLQALSRGRLPPHPRRQRRKQRLHAARLEIQPAASPLQPPRPARDRRSLPHGRVEVEPHRTPPVLRNQQELGSSFRGAVEGVVIQQVEVLPRGIDGSPR